MHRERRALGAVVVVATLAFGQPAVPSAWLDTRSMPRWGSFQARFEAAFGLAEHFAVTTAVRPVIIPDYRADTFRLLGLSLGVRIR